LVYLHNLSGGVLGGDQLELKMQVGAGVQAQVTSTGATRLYRHRPGYTTATQRQWMQVEAGGLLEVLPDALIPFAQARYLQQTSIELAEGAGLFYWEVLAPGRTARDEQFAYEWLRLELDIWVGSRPVTLERIQLEPATRPLNALMRMGEYGYLASFYICRAGVAPQLWRTLEERLAGLADSLNGAGDSLWGASMLTAHGLAVRGLSCTQRAITTALPVFWQCAKEYLYQQPAILPRKLY
jgi:urease accessory protein